jgi:hypothetical protein
MDPRGFTYWVNHVTKKISYNPPQGFKAPAPPARNLQSAPTHTGIHMGLLDELDDPNHVLTQV